MKTGGQIIKEKRESMGLLLRHVAAHLDIDQAVLSRIERGERKPNKDNILKLASVLNVDANELLIQFISDKIVSELLSEECATRTLKVAEQKIKYLKNQLIK